MSEVVEEILCSLCNKPVNPNAIPGEKAIRNAEAASNTKVSGPVCCSCIGELKRAGRKQVQVQNLRSALPQIRWKIVEAVRRDDYIGFSRALQMIDDKFSSIEREIATLLGILGTKTEQRNAIVQARDEAYAKMRASPNASYFERRLEANKFISMPDVRTTVFSRNAYTCVRCGSKQKLTVDHVIPVIAGGKDSLDNLQTLCKTCNCRKGGRVEPSYTTSTDSTTRWGGQ